MAKTNKKSETSTAGSRTSSTGRSQRTASSSSSEKSVSSSKTNINSRKERPDVLSQKQIADRAKEIWRKKGCPAGQDESNWYEAEAQLKKELAVR